MEQVSEPQSLLEWFAEKYKDFGASLEVCPAAVSVVWLIFDTLPSLSRINLRRAVCAIAS